MTTQEDIEKEQLVPMLLLIYIVQDIQKETMKSWKNLFRDENKINDNTITSLINKLKNECEIIIKPNQKFYRARTYKNSEIKTIYNKPIWNDLLNTFKTNIPEFDILEIPSNSMEEFFNYIPFLEYFDTSKSILKNWITKTKCEKFWGYSAKESGRNYKNLKEGRLNKKEEHHLYLAYDIDTAIAEVRPINKQLISVATVNIKKELKVFDLTKNFKMGDGTKDGDYIAFDYLAHLCSLPNFNENEYYKPTQKISSYIKELGYDGIIYPSALKENGKNLLIYEFADSKLDNEYFEIISTEVYTASNEIKITKELPFNEIP